MTMYLLLLFLVFSPKSIISQTIQQSGPELVKPSQQITLTCTCSGFELTNYDMLWIRQAPGKGLEWIGVIWYSGTTAYADLLKSRITITRDTSNKQVFLQMTNMETTDTAMYYCARRHGGTGFDIWGPGTFLTVTAVEPIIPEVFPLIPTGQISNTNAILACLIRGYYPNIVSISWSTTDGDKLSDVNNFISIIPGSPPYTVVSQATDNNGNVNSKTYQCSAISKSISITKIVPKGCDAPPEKPSVEIWQGTCPESNGELEITCQAYNLTSQGATIKWYINGQERTSPKDEVDFGKSQNHFFAMKSTITISLFQWNNGATVKCHVTDPITKKTAEGTIKKCSDSLNCLGINVFMVPPSIEDLYVFNTARILCVAYNLKDPNENYSFKWNVPGTHSDALNVQNENPELHDNGTCSITSVLTVTPDDWNRQTEFTCVFSYKDLQTPIIKRMKKENVAKMSKPVINMIPPSEEEIAQKETCTVGCIISNFNPINIYVGWTDDGMEVYKENFVSSKPKLETNRYTYFIMSKLTIPCSSWENGRRYSCVVGHDTFPMKFITKSIDKSAGKPTVINMVVSMSDTTLSCS